MFIWVFFKALTGREDRACKLSLVIAVVLKCYGCFIQSHPFKKRKMLYLKYCASIQSLKCILDHNHKGRNRACCEIDTNVQL